MEQVRSESDRKNRRTRVGGGETCPTVSFVTTNPTRTDLDVNVGPRGEKSVTNQSPELGHCPYETSRRLHTVNSTLIFFRVNRQYIGSKGIIFRAVHLFLHMTGRIFSLTCICPFNFKKR